MTTTLMAAPLGQAVTTHAAKAAGRTVGVLLLMHLAVGLWIPFLLLDRVKRTAGLVAGAAQSPAQLRAAVLLLFLGGAIAMAVAITAWPVVRRHSSAMALWLVALASAAFALQAVDNAALLSALSLGQEYARSDAASLDRLQALGLVLGLARKWTHYTALFSAVTWMSLLCVVLFRFRLLPRVLAGFGVIATLLQIAGVTLRGFLGYPPEMLMAMPLAPAYLALALWLTVKGFDERHRAGMAPAVISAEDLG